MFVLRSTDGRYVARHGGYTGKLEEARIFRTRGAAGNVAASDEVPVELDTLLGVDKIHNGA